MGKDTGKPNGQKRPTSREDRLKTALKVNLQRRKAQARARAKTGKT
jgi:hypothetical protein